MISGLFWNIIIPVILIIGLSVTLGYLTNARTNMIVGSDPNQETAHKWLGWGVGVGWVVIVLIIVGMVMSLRKRTLKSVSKYGSQSKKMVIFLGLMFVVYGVIAAIAAYNIKKGPDYEENEPYYNDCKWIAITFLGIALLLIIIWLYQKFKKTDQEKMEDELIELQELQASGKSK